MRAEVAENEQQQTAIILTKDGNDGYARPQKILKIGPNSCRFSDIGYNSSTMLRYFTSGESHGEALVAFLSGLPAGLKVDQKFIDRELWRRQQGFGRGGRMKIETDTAHIFRASGTARPLARPSPLCCKTGTGRTGKSRCRLNPATRTSTSV